MKKVSARMFFSVVWMGICQAMGWFFGLFGYNRDGKFAKCVWGLFSVSAAIVMAVDVKIHSFYLYSSVVASRCVLKGDDAFHFSIPLLKFPFPIVPTRVFFRCFSFPDPSHRRED